MRKCGRSASRRAFSRGSTRGRRTFAAAGATGGGATGGGAAGPRVLRSPLCREAVRDGAERTCGAGRCGRRLVVLVSDGSDAGCSVGVVASGSGVVGAGSLGAPFEVAVPADFSSGAVGCADA